MAGNDRESGFASAGTAFAFLLIGAAVGAGVALLCAPTAGKKLRKDLRRGYEDALDRIQDIADDAKERIQEFTADAQNRAEDLWERRADIAESLRDKAAPFAEKLRR